MAATTSCAAWKSIAARPTSWSTTAAGNIGTPQFSPDGKWISYSKEDKLLRNHVLHQELATGEEHMIASDDFQVSLPAPSGRPTAKSCC